MSNIYDRSSAISRFSYDATSVLRCDLNSDANKYLHWLLRVFERRDTKRDDYAYFRTYVPGHWQLSRRRYGRLAQRMLTT
jgi:hypothetical protein